ncbi:PREDICTED: fibrinogen beta chain-like [Nestor notabilis]|uniref:fibrinogen beta chain-like n=1 Tax=Nestor notabilis TaxID=176057 RepID=UPI0005236A29|nr:PREDICTED: fibrinogen beta chain-like [Nestor notabilis]
MGIRGGGGSELSHLDIWDIPEAFEVSLQEAVNTIWVKLSQLEEGYQPDARVFQCATCRLMDCQFPLDCPVQDMQVRTDEAITLLCNVPFATPANLPIVWMFAKDLHTQDPALFEELKVGVEGLFILTIQDPTPGTIACHLGDPSEPLVRKYFYLNGWPRDCSEVSAGSPSSVYIIQPAGLDPMVVYCEMNATDRGWTVIQRNRQSTEITWAESWSTYKYGFGDVHTEYWLGTEYIHHITKQKVYQVRFVIQDSQGQQVHNNMKFSTKDRDQDTYRGNCASRYGGGWWYSACYSVQLNVKGGITWGSLCKGTCKASAILIKPALNH